MAAPSAPPVARVPGAGHAGGALPAHVGGLRFPAAARPARCVSPGGGPPFPAAVRPAAASLPVEGRRSRRPHAQPLRLSRWRAAVPGGRARRALGCCRPDAADASMLRSPLAGPHRPEAQDIALSRLKHGFESRWGRQPSLAVALPPEARASAGKPGEGCPPKRRSREGGPVPLTRELRLATAPIMATTSAADLRRWLERFDAIEAVAGIERAHPLSSADSIRLSLSLIDAMWTAFGGHSPPTPARDREDRTVQDTWPRLRAGSGPRP